MQARWGTHGEHSIIALVPSSVAECFALTVDAFNLSEAYRTPVILLSDATIGHMREAVALPTPDELRVAERGEPDVEPEDYDDVMSTVDNIMPRPALGSRYSGARDRPGLRPQPGGVPATGTPSVAEGLGLYLREKIYHHRDAICRVEELEMEDAEVAIFAYGSVARSARRP